MPIAIGEESLADSVLRPTALPHCIAGSFSTNIMHLTIVTP